MFEVHKINGKVVNPPRNYQDISIELNFDSDSEERGISITRFEWVNEEAAILLAIKNSGLTGGTGVFVGVLHEIEEIENGVVVKALDGYIDLTTADWGKDLVSCDSIAFDSPDFITEKADGFSFEQMYKNGELTDSDVVFVPYVISAIPNYTQALLVIVTLTFMIIELKKLVTELTQKSIEGVSYIDSVGGIIGLVFKIIYGILLLVTIVELILNMADLIIQKIKYKPSMSLNRQLEVAAAKVGLVYESAFLQSTAWSKAHIIPESFNNPETQSDSRIKGFFTPDTNEQHGYYNGTFGDLLRAVKTMFNARIVVGDGKLKIVPLLRTATNGTFKLPSYYVPEFQTNADALVSNYNIIFRYDSNERNTIDSWVGNNMTSFLEVTNATDKRLKLTKGFKQVQIPFARGIRKEELNTIEKIMDAILEGLDPLIGALVSIANAAIKVINAIFQFIEELNSKLKVIGISIKLDLPELKSMNDPKLGQLIDNRIGMLMLESDFITVPKFVMLDVGDEPLKTKLSVENQTHIKALYLYNEFHYTNSFKASKKSAQRIRLNYDKVEMNLSNFNVVANEGIVKLPDGTVADVISCKYNPSSRLANFKIEQRKLYANNLSETISEGEGK